MRTLDDMDHEQKQDVEARNKVLSVCAVDPIRLFNAGSTESANVPRQAVEDTYAKALQAHPNDEWLHLFVAQYLRYYRYNKHVELLHLACAEV